MQVIKDSYEYVFSKDSKPIAYAKDGETLQFNTLDCFGNHVTSEDFVITELDMEKCNPATGPVYIEGAEPGDVLAVDILDVKTGPKGVMMTIKGYGPLWETCESRTKILKVEDGYIYFNDVKFEADPMIGVIGVAPEGKAIASARAFPTGGNMDSRIITKGSTVYLPVKTKGALLQMGDVHAAMGDGEVCETGVEIDAEITVRVRIIKDFELNWPVTEKEDFWFVNTVGKTSNDAIKRGYQELQRLIMNAYGWDATDACMFISAQGRVEANQAVLAHNDTEEAGDTFRVGIPKRSDKPGLIPQK